MWDVLLSGILERVVVADFYLDVACRYKAHNHSNTRRHEEDIDTMVKVCG